MEVPFMSLEYMQEEVDGELRGHLNVFINLAII